MSAATVVGAFILSYASMSSLIDRLKAAILLAPSFLGENFGAAAPHLLHFYFREILSVSISVVGVLLIIGLCAHFIQGGAVLSAKAMGASFKNLMPKDNIRRLFSLSSFVELAKSLVKVVGLGLVLVIVIARDAGALVWTPLCGISCLRYMTAGLLLQVAGWASVTWIIVAIADLVLQRWLFRRKSKMSVADVKRHLKEDEGDPSIRQKRGSIRREWLKADELAKARAATVVVSNPSHIAVAIYYDRQTTQLPLIEAIGTNVLARRMIDAAIAAGVPVMENKSLARALLEDGMVNHYIPVHLIEDVAAVLRTLRRFAAGTDKQPDR